MELDFRLRTFTFRREFPDGDTIHSSVEGATAFIEILGQAGGADNPLLMADMEAIELEDKILARRRGVLAKQAETDEDAAEELMRREDSDDKAISVKRVSAIYKRCIVSWDLNLCGKDGKSLKPSLESFIYLSAVRNRGLSEVVTDFITESNSLGQDAQKQDDDAIKN